MLIAMARAVGCPAVGWQLSLFPYTTRWGSFIYKAVFGLMDQIYVREQMGIESLSRLGVKRPAGIFADSRFALEPSSPDKIRILLTNEGIDPDQPLIGLTTRYLHAQMPPWVRRTHFYSDELAGRSYQALADVVAHLSSLAQVALLPMHPTYEEDLATYEKVKKHVSEASRVKILSRRYSPREIMGIINHCELMLASRLGSVVMAAATGTPVVTIAYESRVVERMERLGLGDSVFDWKQLDPDAIIRAIDRIWYAPHRKKEIAAVNELKTSARVSAEPLDEFLS